LAAVCLTNAAAWGTAPQLTAISPAGGQRGTAVEMIFKGERLQDTEEIICYEPGIQVAALASVTNQSVKAQVKIAPDCSPGEHHLRVRTATGISELRTFFVGAYPVVEETEPNNEQSKAQRIATKTYCNLKCVVNSR